MLPLLVLAVLCWEWHQKKRGQKKKQTWIREKKLFQKECIFFLFVTVFAGWWMWYVFHSEGGSLYAGYTVFGDFSPHTAMIRSFSWGNNFPTQYPYFGGEDIKYHFMFQFLTGNLEYLGIPMEVGFSILGTMFFTAMVILVYSAAQWIFGVFSVGVCSVILLCFRSSFSFWRFVWEHLQKQDLWETLRTNTEFIGYTANENWGLWNLNVYLNQRHLAFGMCALGLALLLYLPDLEKACGGSQNGLSWLKTCWFHWESWKSRNWKRAVFAGVIKKTRVHALVGMAVGTVLTTVLACLINTFVLLPVYGKAFGMPVSAFVEMAQSVHASVDNLLAFAVMILVPFNLFKYVIVSLIVFFIYKRVRVILRGD